MNKQTFSLADVITLLTAVAFGFVCFLGTNFFTLGDTKQSIILAGIIAVLLSATALGAKLLKRTSRNFKTFFIWEMVLLTLFTILTAFVAYSPFPHYFVVSEQKIEIQKKLTTNIDQVKNMFSEYERYAENRKDLYKSKLHSVVAAKSINPSEYTEYGFEHNSVSDDKQIENKLFTLQAELFPSNYSDTALNNGIKEVATVWLSNAKNTVTNWRPIGIVNVVNEVEQNSMEWRSMLIELSSARAKGEQAEDFTYELSFDDTKQHFTTLGVPTPLSIGLAVGAYLLMLLPWFVTKRNSRSQGATQTAAYEIVL